jgi:CCR4-NOT transcription complex subunit 4
MYNGCIHSGDGLLCRYQLCLFCFDRIKLECSNLCPGCRTEYGSEKDPYQKGEAKTRGGSASASKAHHRPRSSPTQRQHPAVQQSSPQAPPHPGHRRHIAATVDATGAGAVQAMAPVSYQPQPLQQQQQQQESPDALWSSLNAETLQDGEQTLPQVSSRSQPGSSLPANQSSQAGPNGGRVWQQDAGHSLSGAGGMPWQGALHGAAVKLGWGCWQRQKRRPAEAGPDLEVRVSSFMCRTA